MHGEKGVHGLCERRTQCNVENVSPLAVDYGQFSTVPRHLASRSVTRLFVAEKEKVP